MTTRPRNPTRGEREWALYRAVNIVTMWRATRRPNGRKYTEQEVEWQELQRIIDILLVLEEEVKARRKP